MARMLGSRILIAGIGNIFLGDDAFGVEVANRVAEGPTPPEVSVRDFGIRGVHLAYELLEKLYDLTILIDATPRGGKPGTVYLIEPEFDGPVTPDVHSMPDGHSIMDAHSMTPDAVFATLKAIGGNPGRVLIVGCEPATVEEGIGLSDPVHNALDEAVKLVRELIAKEVEYVPGHSRAN
jgi:hydrogenase maturation protease